MTTIGGCRRLDDADFRDGHLEVGQDFEQKGLERLVGAVDLVDQQHRRAADARLQRLQQRPLDQIALGKDVVLDAVLVVLAGGLGEADRHHLRGIVPFVDRGRRRRGPRSIAGGSACGRATRRAPWRSRSCRRRPRLRETAAGRAAGSRKTTVASDAVGDIGRAAQQRQRFVDRGRQGRWQERSIPLGSAALIKELPPACEPGGAPTAWP